MTRPFEQFEKSKTHLVDTHCHLADYPDPIAILDVAAAADVAIVAVTEDPDQFRRLKLRLGARPNVEVALGLHPLRAASVRPADLARFLRMVPAAGWIGEVGLDFSPVGAATRKAQLRVFETILGEAQPGRHPLTVHSRGAAREVITRLTNANVPAVLHWYSGPLALVDDALAAGLYFSINPAMVRSKRGTALIGTIPTDRILLETDGPYAFTRKRPVQPDDLYEVVSALARVWRQPADVVANRLSDNIEIFMNRIPRQ
ncbi:TatD family hydrolase [Mycobacterium intracellulare]|uniref:TatD family hydrolase n=1 Tax=Mycobacterium intracellulare TaxID=1767 RepID=A0AAE4RH39_MYCIT|nr:TatD family hydrolase [Mycobacterium intracellulare]MCA2320449.1 TatD family hydrolase [Mycobacterium intracellulare]MCA2340899.1 TatD family hydrolase [Mycobacterium intracellulare]MDV6979062.1 TatD family hydrolase [Mycobacterium intracellulare]MDV6984368.1 TatD family hydrolase [Mycobacterium intracellulare]MDV7014078.1 TatD family hydrolase [Mycobacterium intracellulare]